MKTCPQCNLSYQDDYLFCLTDGNTLKDKSGEQETRLANRLVFSEMAAGQSAESMAACSVCGLANRANSKFCKKCGGPLAAANVSGAPASPAAGQPFGFGMSSDNPPFQPVQNRYARERAFQSPVFTPPSVIGQQYAAANGRKNQTNILIAAVVIGAAIVAGAVIYSSQAGSNKPASNTSNANTNKPAANTVANARNAPAQNTTPVSPLIGRKGRLTTNQRIRSDSHKNAGILGVHYQGALIEVLEVKSYYTEDGTYATWYRVRVLEDGCDREGRMGCGNDLNEMPGQAASEGWMNAKNISLD